MKGSTMYEALKGGETVYFHRVLQKAKKEMKLSIEKKDFQFLENLFLSVAPLRIELRPRVPETLVLSIILWGLNGG